METNYVAEVSRTNVKDIFAEKLSLEDAQEILADVVEDGTRARVRQVYEGHAQILKVLAKFERHMTTNYGVEPKLRKSKRPVSAAIATPPGVVL